MGHPDDRPSPPHTELRGADGSAAERSPAPPRAPFCWVPIRSLGERHRDRILEHLIALDSRDRYLRFGFSAGDEQLANYVRRLDFSRDELFGIFNRRLRLIGNAHLAFPSSATTHEESSAEAEFGVSVLATARGRGFGMRMFESAMLRARNRGVDTMLIHALSENSVMLHLARKAGATVLRDGAQAQARLKLPPDDLASRVGELFEQHAAEFDYRLKAHARQFERG